MDAEIILIVTLFICSTTALNTENEMYLNFEPLPEKRDGWPVTRAVHMQFGKRSEDGREFRSLEGCRILESINDIAREVARMPMHAIKRISKKEMQTFEGRCEPGEEVERTIAGTKWCGAGNKAKSYSDLGYFSTLDSCCRDHDHCDNIPAGETKYGLINKGRYTMMNCKCEKAFKACLDNIKGFWSSKGATAVKKFYFNIYGNGCYNVICQTKKSAGSECPNPIAKYTGKSGFGAKTINRG